MSSPTLRTRALTLLTAVIAVSGLLVGGLPAQAASPNLTVDGISPVFGPVTGGTAVTINGTGFNRATTVTFGGVSATSFTRVSSNQIIATTPQRLTPGAVTVAVNSVPSLTQFTYYLVPTVTSFTPTAGPLAGGTSVVFTGTNLGDALSVTFGAAAGSITANTATSITVTTPPALVAAAVPVVVTTKGGPASAGNFTYANVPVITAVSPIAGPLAGGVDVVLTGSNFTGATAVLFGTTAGTNVRVNSATQITVRTPAHAAGGVIVSVTIPAGTGVSAANAYTYQDLPTITSVLNASSDPLGPIAGGTAVTITGTNLLGATAVKFDGVAATSVVAVSATKVTAVTPAHVAGGVKVSVTTPVTQTFTSTTDLFWYYTTPTITSLVPEVGAVAGSTVVEIKGTNLFKPTSVLFGTASATVVSVSTDGTLLTVKTPAGTANAVVDVTFTGIGGTVKKTAAFTFSDAPIISTVSRFMVATAGGTKVTLTGSNFTGATAVKFGTVNATSYSVTSPTTIVAYAPAGTLGAVVAISVTSAAGTGTKANAVQYGVAKPIIASVSPSVNAVAGVTSVLITGSNLYELTAVKFGSTVATITVPADGSQVAVKVPAGLAGKYTISIVSPDGVGSKSDAISVVSNALCTPVSLGTVTFAYKSSKLTAAMKAKLNNFATLVLASKCTAVVLDRFMVTVKPTTSKAIIATQNLAIKRYIVVAQYLKAKLLAKGVVLTTVSTKMLGQKPMTSTSTTDMYSVNRRISVRAS